jgi:putative DNA primase/helicase
MGWSETGIGATSQQITCQLRTSRPWNPPHLLAFSNGTLDTASNTFVPTHRRTDFLTLCLPYPYDPNATCPRWLAFIHEALAGQQGSIAVIRAAIRWTLQPKDITQPFDIEACIDIGGRRGTGKGTTAEVILGLLGGIGHGAGCFSTASIQKPTALHQLIGKRAAVDTDASGHIADAGTFNRIVSNEPVEVKKLYVNETTARLGVVVWRFFNDAITVSGGGEEGMGRRIVTLTFNEQPARRDRGLKAVLRRELPGIFAWVWALDLDDAKGTLANAAVHDEIRTAAISAAFHRNPKLRFLYETFPDGAVGIASLDLYRQWCSWCEQEGHKPGTHASFSKEVVKVAGEPRRVGKAKVTTLDIPAMVNFDIAAHLGLLDATDAAHGRRVVAVDVIPPADQFSTDASNPHCRPPDVHPDAHLTSNQSPCHDSLSIYVDVTSLSKKEGIEEDAGEGRKTGQTPVESQECFVDAPAVHLAGSQPQNPPPCTAPWLLQDPGGAGGTARLLTVTEQVEAVLDAQCISPSHPQARNAAFQTLSGRGISRNQVTAAIDHLRQREAKTDNPLLDFL